MISAKLTIDKTEHPGLTSKRLLEAIKYELEMEGINNTTSEDNRIIFKNDKFKLSFSERNRSFVGFDEGWLTTSEDENQLKLLFKSSSRKTLQLFAITSLLILLLALYVSGPLVSSFLMGPFAFLVFSAKYLVHTQLNISSYLSSLEFTAIPLNP